MVLLVQAGHVIAVQASVLFLDVGVQHALPIGGVQQAGQQGWLFGVMRTRSLFAFFDDGMGLVPQSLCNDGLMLAGVALALVRHLTQVHAVAQQLEHILLIHGTSGVKTAALSHPGLGGVPLNLEFAHQLGS